MEIKMKQWWKAVESGFRAGLKQYRKMRTLQARASLLDPLQE